MQEWWSGALVPTAQKSQGLETPQIMGKRLWLGVEPRTGSQVSHLLMRITGFVKGSKTPHTPISDAFKRAMGTTEHTRVSQLGISGLSPGDSHHLGIAHQALLVQKSGNFSLEDLSAFLRETGVRVRRKRNCVL